ncbi:TolC family protein [Sphingomonas sp. SUN019]|uniref:efflux transporter outer membrane subunit n=1 Tax=Sphingomonas sp. SUN019 TaxID=2937788 RepID=UPI0021646DAE|nr:TolC family protein [Sphingomonas sp. SUN019]UVO49667.1 TolC family protein [Sphingomonas sp. SUN019]
MRPTLASILFVALPLGACAGHPDYVRPSVSLGDAFRNEALQPAGARIRVEDRWWRAFGDPVLDRLIDEALSGSLEVEIAAARLEQAAAGVRSARAQSLPLIAAVGSGAIQRQSIADPSGRFVSRFPGYERTSEQYGLTLAASWEIDLFGSLAAGRRAALADLSAADAALAGARLTVAAEIATTYLNAREFEVRLAIARDRATTLGSLDGLVRLRFSRGVAARLEVDQVAADLATARSAIPAIEAAREVAFNRIDLLAGRAPGFSAAEIRAAAIPAAPIIAGDAGPASLLFRRPDLVAAERAVAAADARTAQALAERYPKVTIGALAGLLSGGVSNLFTGSASRGAADAGISGPLLDFGRTGAAVDRARAQTREAVANYRLAVLRAASEAENGFSTLARSQAQAAALDRSVVALARARDTSRLAYRAGAVSLIEALDAERRLQASQDSASSARADAARAAVATFRALGGGWKSI